MNKLNEFEASVTVELHNKALQLKKQGRPVFSLAVGEPELSAEKLLSAANRADFGYPPVAGLLELRKKVAFWVNRSYDCDYKAEEVTVVPGAKMGIFLLLRTLLRAGDVAAVIAPYWVSYPSLIKLCYGRPRILKTSAKNRWKITAADIENLKTNRCRALILNNASNPCAVLYSEQELVEILSVAAQKNIFVISDEVYGSLVYDGNRFYSCGRFGKFRHNLAVVQSCSKNFAMPGIRTGFVLAPERIVKTLNVLNGQTTSGVSQLSQAACLRALGRPDEIVLKVKQAMQNRRDLMHRLLKRYWAKDFELPQSALYFFLRVSDLHPKYRDDLKFCHDVLNTHHVIVIPGTAFGQRGYVRLSFGGKPAVIREAIRQLAKFCGKL